MSKLEWGKTGERFYETGIDRGVLYTPQGYGVPWNGLVSVDEDPAGGEVEALYFDGVKYYDFVAAEDFQAKLEAVSAPPEFALCEGNYAILPGLMVTHQPRVKFGLSYRTKIGNDLKADDYGYKLHLVYNVTAEADSRSYETLGDSSSVPTRGWTLHTVPPTATTYKPTAHFIVNSTLVAPAKLAALEARLYGVSGGADAVLPTQQVVIQTLT